MLRRSKPTASWWRRTKRRSSSTMAWSTSRAPAVSGGWVAAEATSNAAGKHENLSPLWFNLASAQVGTVVAEQAGRQVPGGDHGDHRGSRGSRFVCRGQNGRVDLGETETHGRGVPLLPKMRRWSLHAAHITRRAALLITLVMNGRSAPLVPRPAEINGDVKYLSFRVYLRFHCADVRFDRLS